MTGLDGFPKIVDKSYLIVCLAVNGSTPLTKIQTSKFSQFPILSITFGTLIGN